MGRQYCSMCKEEVATEVDESAGFECCVKCGRVFNEHIFSTDPTFSKSASGASTVDGTFVPESGVVGASATVLAGRGMRGSRIFGYQIDSHEKTVGKGKAEIAQIAERLGMRPREELVGAAHRLYKLAVQRNFTRGRRTNQVAGSCLYIVCRQEDKPYMLIDFSDALQTNVYILGSVFLQLCRLLRLESHPVIRRPVDPSLYIHRFADKLPLPNKRAHHLVVNTALRLVASMKRDWMQTGRRPSGVCGAALFVAARMHGNHTVSKKDVVSVVHVGEGTLNRRLTEFEKTPSWDMTMDEFETRALEYEEQQRKLLLEGGSANASASGAGAASAPRLALPSPIDEAVAKAQALALEVAAEASGEAKAAEGVLVPFGSPAAGAGAGHASGEEQVLTCVHANTPGVVAFKHGMCRACFEEFLHVSGGTNNTGLDPPAMRPDLYQAKRKRRKFQTNPDVLPPPPPPPPITTDTGVAAVAIATPPTEFVPPPPPPPLGGVAIAPPPPPPPSEAADVLPSSGVRSSKGRAADLEREMDEALHSAQMRAAIHSDQRGTLGPHEEAPETAAGAGSAPPVAAAASQPSGSQAATQPAEHTATQSAMPGSDAGAPAEDVVDTLSDIDDDDIGQYINTKEEAMVKTEIWTKLNADWAAAQEEKKKLLAAQGDAAGKAASNRKRKKQAEMEGLAPLPRPGRPAATAAEAARSMAASRKLSSKINYAALDSLFVGGKGGAGAGAGSRSVRAQGGEASASAAAAAEAPAAAPSAIAPLPGTVDAAPAHMNAAVISARVSAAEAGGRGRGRGRGGRGRGAPPPGGRGTTTRSFVPNRSLLLG